MRKIVVVDTSLALKWIYTEDDSFQALSLLAQWIKDTVEIRVPSLLAYEITNSLYQQVRAGRVTLESAKKSLMETLPEGLVFVFLPDLTLSVRALEFAHRFGLSATYDSHYLALAEREKCEFWTADTKMWRAVKDQLLWVHRLADYHPS
jgi:predicted nucleic acid-binding protein